MAIPNATVAALDNEGITLVDDLAEFDKTTIEAIAANFRRPAAGQPLVFGAKSQKRLTVATDLVRYYHTVGRPLTAANLQWNLVMKDFEIQWKALKGRKDEDEPDIPKITKTLGVMKWCEAFVDYVHRLVGARTIPLAYVIREDAVVPAVCQPIDPGHPHAAEYGSIEDELIARASHEHPLYKTDNASVYYKLEESTRGTAYAASIKPYQRGKNGRGAFLALKAQHAGDDKWSSELTKQDNVLHNQKWKGQGNYTLEKHCGVHRNAFVQMEAASTHVPYQLPNGYTRVGFLLDSIECSDAELQAAMASIKRDKTTGGLREDFEQAVATLLPADPVAKKVAMSGNKRVNAHISGTQDNENSDATIYVSSLNIRSGKGPKTGVDLRYYKQKEYQRLTKEQKDELRSWRETPEGKRAMNDGKSNKKPKPEARNIAAMVDRKVQEKMEALKKEKTSESEAKAYIQSVVQEMANGKSNTPVQAASADATGNLSSGTTFLRSILRKSKN